MTQVVDPCHRDRCRLVAVDHVIYTVPRHIYRSGKYGWMVMFPTEEDSRYFGDHQRSPRLSLAEAKEWLRKVYEPIPKNTRRDIPRSRPIAGIFEYMVQDKSAVVVACAPTGATKWFSIGKRRTAEQAMDEALRERAKMLRETPIRIR